MRLGIRSDSPLANKTLDGSDKKWVRGRVISTLAGLPSVEYIKIQTSHALINKDGFVDFQGDGRNVSIGALPINWKGVKSELYLSDKLVVDTVEYLTVSTSYMTRQFYTSKDSQTLL